MGYGTKEISVFIARQYEFDSLPYLNSNIS